MALLLMSLQEDYSLHFLFVIDLYMLANLNFWNTVYRCVHKENFSFHVKIWISVNTKLYANHFLVFGPTKCVKGLAILQECSMSN